MRRIHFPGTRPSAFSEALGIAGRAMKGRRNTRGLPLGLSRHEFNRAHARTVSYPTKVVRIGTDDIEMPLSETRRDEIINTHDTLERNRAARAEKQRLPKIARRVAYKRHSSSAMRSMVDIMERREAERLRG